MAILSKLIPSVSVHQVIVPEEDHHTFSISHPQHLRLIASPLAGEDDAHDSHGHPAVAQETHRDSTSSEEEKQKQDPDVPVLKRAHEASTIQLFFDLFFVANLTTFTTIHEIDDWEALKSYIGYFGILWFTWLQNTLFDVRFSNDSAFERMCKAMQFGIMTGFAVTGPGYTTGWKEGTPDSENAIATFKTLSLILMASRLILTFQYGVAFWWLRSYKKAIAPMVTHMAILFTSAMIWLGLSFAFTAGASERILISWYVLVAIEALAILLVSGNVTFLSFRPTVLVERLGLLTLIILGEGIIGMCGSINKVGSDRIYSANVIGNIICSVCIMYFMWMLYFDQIQPERMGTLRQHIWAVLHFPFHVCVILVVEGLSRLSVWRKLLDIMLPLQTAFANIPKDLNRDDVVDYLNHTLSDLYDKFEGSRIPRPNLNSYFEEISHAASNSTDRAEGIDNIYSGGVNWVCENFKVAIHNAEHHVSDESEKLDDVFSSFKTVFIYFFLFAGLVLILLAILFLLGKRRKLRTELLSVCVRVVFGLGIASLALMAVRSASNRVGSSYGNFMYSAWMLPTVLLSYFLVIVLDNLLIRYVVKIVHWRRHVHASHPRV